MQADHPQPHQPFSSERFACPLCGERFRSYSTYYSHVRRVAEKLVELGYLKKAEAWRKNSSSTAIVYEVNGSCAVGTPEALRLIASGGARPPSCRSILNAPPPATLEALTKALHEHLAERKGTEAWVPLTRISSAAGAGRVNGFKAREAAELLLSRPPPSWQGVGIKKRKKLLFLVFMRSR